MEVQAIPVRPVRFSEDVVPLGDVAVRILRAWRSARALELPVDMQNKEPP